MAAVFTNKNCLRKKKNPNKTKTLNIYFFGGGLRKKKRKEMLELSQIGRILWSLVTYNVIAGKLGTKIKIENTTKIWV